MAGVSGGKPRYEGGSGLGDGASAEQGLPEAFRAAVAELLGTRLRPEITLGETPAPRRLAPYAHALTATVEAEGEELADGRLVLLHDPSGHEAWRGEFRLVSLTQAELEREIADDPLLAEVGWSWLTDALEQFGCAYAEPGGTVSRAYSQYFGAMADRPSSTEIEIRASWTPIPRGDGSLDLGAHLRAWGELLCLCAGLPPSPLPLPAPGAPTPPAAAQPSSVVPMPTRRQPRGGA
jgi:hypothetical protein